MILIILCTGRLIYFVSLNEYCYPKNLNKKIEHSVKKRQFPSQINLICMISMVSIGRPNVEKQFFQRLYAYSIEYKVHISRIYLRKNYIEIFFSSKEIH